MPNDDGLPGLSHDGFSATLHRFVAEARVDQAAVSRSKQRWLTDQLAGESGFLGTLTNLAEAKTIVTVALLPRQVLRCTILMVGTDFALTVDENKTEHLIALTAINRLETGSSRSVTSEHRPLSPVMLCDALSVLAEDRPEVAVHHLDGSGTRGELRRATSDEIQLSVRAPTFRRIVVRLGSISHLSTKSW